MGSRQKPEKSLPLSKSLVYYTWGPPEREGCGHGFAHPEGRRRFRMDFQYFQQAFPPTVRGRTHLASLGPVNRVRAARRVLGCRRSRTRGVVNELPRDGIPEL